MWFPSLSALWRACPLPTRSGPPARPKPTSTRLTVESLEDRSVPATLSISDAFVGEGGVAVFSVYLSEASTGPVTVHFATLSRTAYGIDTEKGDFRAESGKLTFRPGETVKTISIQTYYDSDWGDEHFGIELSAAKGAAILDGEGIGVIKDSDFWGSGGG